MSREVRRVPANWEHPKDENGHYQPLYDTDYETAMTEWIKNHQLWLEGQHPDQLEEPERLAKYKYFVEWDSSPPDFEYYRPKWTDEERTHYQIYETTSEGTPLTPPFATKEELARYCADNRVSTFADMTTTYERWLSMIEQSSSIASMMFNTQTGQIVSGVDAVSES